MVIEKEVLNFSCTKGGKMDVRKGFSWEDNPVQPHLHLSPKL